MARFEANIAALVSLRQAVLTFRGRMADAIDAADAEIRRVAVCGLLAAPAGTRGGGAARGGDRQRPRPPVSGRRPLSRRPARLWRSAGEWALPRLTYPDACIVGFTAYRRETFTSPALFATLRAPAPADAAPSASVSSDRGTHTPPVLPGVPPGPP